MDAWLKGHWYRGALVISRPKLSILQGCCVDVFKQVAVRANKEFGDVCFNSSMKSSTTNELVIYCWNLECNTTYMGFGVVHRPQWQDVTGRQRPHQLLGWQLLPPRTRLSRSWRRQTKRDR